MWTSEKSLKGKNASIAVRWKATTTLRSFSFFVIESVKTVS